MKKFEQPKQQSGTALVASLVILMIITLLGVTAMNSASIQEKMAINMQTNYSGFHIAESGLNQIFNDGTSLNTIMQQVSIGNTSATSTANTSALGNNTGNGSAEVTTSYTGSTDVVRSGGGFSVGGSFTAHNFMLITEATVNGQVTNRIKSGIMQFAPSGN